SSRAAAHIAPQTGIVSVEYDSGFECSDSALGLCRKLARSDSTLRIPFANVSGKPVFEKTVIALRRSWPCVISAIRVQAVIWRKCFGASTKSTESKFTFFRRLIMKTQFLLAWYEVTDLDKAKSFYG